MALLKNIALCLIFGLSSAPVIASETRLHLVPGQATSITMPQDAAINVSRRGVVDLHHTSGNEWQVTALHAGLVLIEARALAAEPDDTTRFLIEIAPADEMRKRGRMQGADLPDWLCTPAQINCDRTTGIVTGLAPSWGWLVQAAQACQPTHGCLLQAGLTDADRELWKNALAAFAEPPRLTISADGFVQLRSFCGSDGKQPPDKSPFPEALVPKSRLATRCAPPEPDAGYDLSARIFLVDNAMAQTLGFDSAANAAGTIGRPSPNGASLSLLSRLNALANEQRATVIGEPRVHLLPGRKITLRAGGEFQVAEYRDELHGPAAAPTTERLTAASSWKQTGLDLTVNAANLKDGTVRLDFNAALKLRVKSSGEPSLTVGSVESAIDLEPGVPQLAATLDLSTRADGSSETPALSHIPILGFLFRRNDEERAHHRLVVWFTIERPATADDQELTPK